MTPENHTLFDWNTVAEYSDLKRLQMVFPSLPADGLLWMRLVTCAVAAGEMTGRWSRCSRPVLQESSTRIRRWSRFAANYSAILR